MLEVASDLRQAPAKFENAGNDMNLNKSGDREVGGPIC